MKAKKELITKINRIVKDQRLDPNKLGLFALLFAWINTEDNEKQHTFIENIITAQYITKSGIKLVEDKNLVSPTPNTNIEKSAGDTLSAMLGDLGFGGKDAGSI